MLAIDDGRVNVVLEMTDSTRTVWNTYLGEAERNRNAQASLGLVRSPDQLHGNGLQSYGSRRIVLAFDPENDDPDLLRTVVQLLRLSALSAAARQDSGEIQTAQEKVAEALALLSKIDGIKTTAGQIKKSGESRIATNSTDRVGSLSVRCRTVCSVPAVTGRSCQPEEGHHGHTYPGAPLARGSPRSGWA